MKSVSVWCVSACLSVSLAAAVAAQAPALDVKMGLWEMTNVSTVSGQMPTIDTSKMSPEQRARFEEAMKKRGTPRTTVTKSCLTKEKFERSAFMMEDQPGRTCKQSILTNTRSRLDATLTCTGEHPVTGQIHVDALSPTNVKISVTSASAMPDGAMNINMTMTGKWIGADCGNEK
jgi:hypothetical protein